MMLSNRLTENIAVLQQTLPLESSFDFFSTPLMLQTTQAYFLGINGLCDAAFLQQLLIDLNKNNFFKDCKNDLPQTIISKLGYAQITIAVNWDQVFNPLLCGTAVLFLDGYREALIIDARTYPTRSMEEPDLEKSTKGARDGFVETLLFNANLIRRRVRSTSLCFTRRTLGTISRTDVAVAYLSDAANPKLVQAILDKLDSLSLTALTMGSRSLEELLVPKKWFHPLPVIKSTERPDVACSYLLEGHVLLLVDNSPAALILPCSIFQFIQNPEDYCNSPSVGTYLRLLRFLCIPISLFLLPVFQLLTMYYPDFSARWQLLPSQEIGPVTIFFYVLAVEFFLNLFKYSSSISSGKYSGSMSIIGGLLISDIAVSLRWASLEILFYGAITLLASYAISNSDFSDALKLYRFLLILFTGFGGTYGFCLGVGLMLLSVLTTPTFGGFSYFWPLLPFEKKALGSLLFRSPTPKAQPDKVWSRGPIQKEKSS